MYQHKNTYTILENNINGTTLYGISVTTVLSRKNMPDETHEVSVKHITTSYETILYIKDLFEQNDVQWMHVKDVLQDLM